MSDIEESDRHAIMSALSEFAESLNQLCLCEAVRYRHPDKRKMSLVDSVEFTGADIRLNLHEDGPLSLSVEKIERDSFFRKHALEQWIIAPWL